MGWKERDGINDVAMMMIIKEYGEERIKGRVIKGAVTCTTSSNSIIWPLPQNCLMSPFSPIILIATLFHSRSDCSCNCIYSLIDNGFKEQVWT